MVSPINGYSFCIEFDKDSLYSNNKPVASVAKNALITLFVQDGNTKRSYCHKIEDPSSLIKLTKFCVQENEDGISQCINNYDIKDKKILLDLVKIIAQNNPWKVSEYIQNYGITDQQDLIEIAKLIAQIDGHTISYHIQNYGITNQQDLIEIAKLAAQNNLRATSHHIQNYGITNQQDLIEIAKLAAQIDGYAISHHIQNYGITNQQDLIEIAKLAAQNSGGKFSKYFKFYEIKDEKARIEVAKIAVQSGDKKFSQFIKDYEIKDEKTRIEIAKLAAQNDARGVFENISRYEITDQKALIEIAKLIAPKEPTIISTYIKVCGITDQRGIVEVAKLVAQNDGFIISRNIKKYGVTSQKDLIEIAKVSAKNNAWETFQCIQNYGIKDEGVLIEVAKLAAQTNGWGVSENIRGCQITDEKARIEIAKIAARSNGWAVSQYIEGYQITDEKARIEIAKIAAQNNGWGVSLNISHYEIIDEKSRIEIAMLALQNNGFKTFEYIKKYHITDQDVLMEIACFVIKNSIVHNTTTNIWGLLSDYDVSDQKIYLLQLFYACCYKLFGDNTNVEIETFIESNTRTKEEEVASFSNFNKRIAAITNSQIDVTEKHKQEKLIKEKQKALEYFSLVQKFCREKNISLEPRVQNYFIKILKHRNQREACVLFRALTRCFENPTYFSNYQLLVSNKEKDIEHLVLPMMLINQWFATSFNQQEDILQNENVQKVKGFLTGRIQRASLRKAQGFLPNLLQALIALSAYSNISSEKKLYLLNQCFSFSCQKSDWEKFCKQSLDTVRVLADANLLPAILEELETNYDFEEIQAQLNTRLQTDIFTFEKEEANFLEKYLYVEKALRVPLALIKYANILRSHQDPRVRQELQRLITSSLEGTIREKRYQIENNPHLQQIKEKEPNLFNAWQTIQIPEEKLLDNSKKQSVDFLSFLQGKIVIDDHFPNAPTELKQYLQNPKQSLFIDGLNEVDRKISLLCKDLCSSSSDFQQKLDILKKLPDVLQDCEFKNDVRALLTNLTVTGQLKKVLVVDTDDWQDLFLSGTEVLGSCQRIDGNLTYNVCLMAYVLDGKNRLLAIKDPVSGRILARCIFRLLWIEEEGKPALFQEVIYPFPCPLEYEELLNTLADTRAKELGLKLYTLNNRQDNLSDKETSLESLGGCSPYEYVDACAGVKRDGVFTISGAKAVNLK